MTDQHRFTDADLNAYLDGELDDARAALVEQWLDTDTEASATLAAYRQQRGALRDQFDPILDEAQPAAMTAALDRAAVPARRPIWWQVAAAVLLLMLGGGGGWMVRDQVLPPLAPAVAQAPAPIMAMANSALTAHAVYVPEVLHPVEVEASKQKHLLTWLSKRIGMPLSAPDMTRIGFDLVGGRLLPAPGEAAAQLMYENADGRRLTLYIRKVADTDSTAFRFVNGNGYSAFYWMDAPLGYALVGDLPRQQLLVAATQVYGQLNR